jgi:ribosome assembly protein YihI (activator of Der GTPase)
VDTFKMAMEPEEEPDVAPEEELGEVEGDEELVEVMEALWAQAMEELLTGG